VQNLLNLDPVLRPFRIELELIPFFLRFWNWNEVGSDSANIDGLVRDSFLGEFEVPSGFGERRVQNGIFYDDLGHVPSSSSRC